MIDDSIPNSGLLRSYFNAFLDKENNSIIVSGGVKTTDNMRVKTVQKFNLNTNSWVMLPDM